MYAVIETGGKQYRVTEGQRLEVEHLGVETPGEVTFTPILLVDDDTLLARPAELSGATVSARVVAEAKGPKIIGLTYKNKTRSRRRWGHRQRYTVVEITGITKG